MLSTNRLFGFGAIVWEKWSEHEAAKLQIAINKSSSKSVQTLNQLKKAYEEQIRNITEKNDSDNILATRLRKPNTI